MLPFPDDLYVKSLSRPQMNLALKQRLTISEPSLKSFGQRSNSGLASQILITYRIKQDLPSEYRAETATQ